MAAGRLVSVFLLVVALLTGLAVLYWTRARGTPSRAFGETAALVTGKAEETTSRVSGPRPESLTVEPTASPSAEDPAWAAAIDRLMLAGLSDRELSSQLTLLLPALDPEGQVEAAWRITALTGDESYAPVSALFLSSTTTPAASRIFFQDLLGRPDELRLPVLVEATCSPWHPLRTEAREKLVEFLGYDLGVQREAWSAAIGEFLRSQARAGEP